MQPAPRTPLPLARMFVMALAVSAVALLLASGPGTRAGLWPWAVGLGMMRWAFYIGAAAAIGAAMLIVTLAIPRLRVRPWVPVLALCIALVAVVPPLLIVTRAKAVPPIHDITTDLAEPPAFVALQSVRAQAPNGSAHAGESVAAMQRQGYPDIKPLVLAAPPRETMQRALDAARALGWEVAASDAAQGRLEATHTTTFFGFKDDVVVRIRAEGTGSRVDVRSVSRVGRSDLGANARRIREFLAKLA